MSETTSARIFNGVMGVLDLLGMKRWRARTVAPIKGTILEIGAGGGRDAQWLDPRASVVALDPDFELLKLAREKSRPQVRVVVAVAEALPFKDDSFDSALATLVLCRVDDQHKAASELKRTLRPGELVADTVFWLKPDWFVPLLGVIEVLVGIGLLLDADGAVIAGDPGPETAAEVGAPMEVPIAHSGN